MGRFFREKFEVKNEMRDGGKVRHKTTSSTGGQMSEEERRRIMEEANKIGFDDDYEEVVKDVPVEKEQISEIDRIARELEEYYTDDIDNEYTKTYLKNSLKGIYDAELSRLGMTSLSDMVDTYFEDYMFEGVDSYRELVANIDDAISKRKASVEKREVVEEEKLFSLPDEEKERILSGCRNIGLESELYLGSYIASEAKKLGIEKAVLKGYLREEEKSRIVSPEKVLHYHRTSLDSAISIIESNYFLSRAGIKERGGDISKFNGSSSSNVQFSVDKYNEQGEMVASGYNPSDNLGATSTDVVFVMGEGLIKEKSYDCFGKYPTVEQADISKSCVTILAKDEKTLQTIQEKLTEQKMYIKVILQKDFDREAILTQVEGKSNSISNEEKIETPDVSLSVSHKTNEEEKGISIMPNASKSESQETGFVQKNINGKEILSSAVEATEKSVIVSDIQRQQGRIVELEKARMASQEKGLEFRPSKQG